MTGKVIQGLFINGRPRIAPQEVQPKTTMRSPGPPPTVFAGRIATAQAHGAHDAFQVDTARLGLVSGGGRLLPDVVRNKMEAALGADFSSVRVHVGPQAERIGAIAFTVGSDIYFAPGRYQPQTLQGQQVLGHELAHVLQQRAGRVRNPLGAGMAVVQDRVLEAEADRLGHRAATHQAAIQPKLPPGTQPVSPPVRISAPISTGPGSYRLTAGAGGRQVGSVMVHARDRGAVEVTDLGVAPAHREHGIGKLLLASAARTAQQMGRSKVALAAQDNGSGHLTRWYKEMGFMQVGLNRRGYPELEAPISRVLNNAMPPVPRIIARGRDVPGGPAASVRVAMRLQASLHRERGAKSSLIQRMEITSSKQEGKKGYEERHTTIPRSSVLFHGSPTKTFLPKGLPTPPAWFAADPQFSMHVCAQTNPITGQGNPSAKVYLHNFTVIHAIKVLQFKDCGELEEYLTSNKKKAFGGNTGVEARGVMELNPTIAGYVVESDLGRGQPEYVLFVEGLNALKPEAPIEFTEQFVEQGPKRQHYLEGRLWGTWDLSTGEPEYY
jgi:ribosomal protein S18 acetylase RimI-like enzyme